MSRAVAIAPSAAGVCMPAMAVGLELTQAGSRAPTTFGHPLVTGPYVVASAVVGSAILWRHRFHAVGLIFAASTLLDSLLSLAQAYARLALFTHAGLLGGVRPADANLWLREQAR
jgi:hypothetical protein